MNGELSLDFIKSATETINTNYNIEYIYPESTLNYLLQLLIPIEQTLSQLITKDQFESWAENNIYEYSYLVFEYLDDKKEDYQNDHLVLHILNVIAKLIIHNAHKISKGWSYKSSYVLPWDIQSSIHYLQLDKLFKMKSNDDKLPVILTSEGDSCNLLLTEDFLMGLLLSYYMGQSDINVTMFDYPITIEMLIDRYLDQEHDFGVIIDDDQYSFYSLDFMNGFVTGAGWLGLNHYEYWSDLKDYRENDEGINITF